MNKKEDVKSSNNKTNKRKSVKTEEQISLDTTKKNSEKISVEELKNIHAYRQRKSQENFRRVSINFPWAVNEKIEKYAQEHGYNFSQAVLVLIHNSLEQNSFVDILPTFVKIIDEERKRNSDLN